MRNYKALSTKLDEMYEVAHARAACESFYEHYGDMIIRQTEAARIQNLYAGNFKLDLLELEVNWHLINRDYVLLCEASEWYQ